MEASCREDPLPDQITAYGYCFNYFFLFSFHFVLLLFKWNDFEYTLSFIRFSTPLCLKQGTDRVHAALKSCPDNECRDWP